MVAGIEDNSSYGPPEDGSSQASERPLSMEDTEEFSLGDSKHVETTGEWLVYEMDHPWLPRVNLKEATSVILRLNRRTAGLRVEWPAAPKQQYTNLDPSPIFSPISAETAEFIEQQGLHEAVAWLEAAAPDFFPGASLGIDLLPGEDGEDAVLLLEVFGTQSVTEFAAQRHSICKALVEEDHLSERRRLYEILSIVLRRIGSGGLQALSLYSAPSEA